MVRGAVDLKKKKKLFTLLEKKRIIERVENGEKQVDVAKEFGVAKSTINTMWLNREKIKEAAVTCAKGVIRVENRKMRHAVMDDMEKLLLIWVKEMEMRGEPVSGDHIKKKARIIYEELVKDHPDAPPPVAHSDEGSEEEGEEDRSHGGFRGETLFNSKDLFNFCVRIERKKFS